MVSADQFYQTLQDTRDRVIRLEEQIATLLAAEPTKPKPPSAWRQVVMAVIDRLWVRAIIFASALSGGTYTALEAFQHAMK